MQGVRGRVQGVERRARRPARLHRASPTTTRERSAPNRWRHVAFIEQDAARRTERHALADELRRVQALHRGSVPGRVPDGRALPHRVRHRRGAGGRVQRLRILRGGLPVRSDRPARGRRARLEVHDVLRPAQGRPRARLREGVPDRLDPVRPAGRAARARRGTSRAGAGGGCRRGTALRRRPGRRRGRGRRLLPAARRPRGVRAAARPGGPHPRPRRHLAVRRRGRRVLAAGVAVALLGGRR